MEPFCKNEGRELTGQERMDTGLGHAHVWRVCNAGMTFNNLKVEGVVCRSNGCNPKCGKFVAIPLEVKSKSPPAAGETVAKSVDSGKPAG